MVSNLNQTSTWCLTIFICFSWLPCILMIALPTISKSKLSQIQTISEIKLGSLFSQQYLLTKVDALGRSAGRSEIHDCIQAIKGTPQASAVPLTLKIVREGIQNRVDLLPELDYLFRHPLLSCSCCYHVIVLFLLTFFLVTVLYALSLLSCLLLARLSSNVCLSTLSLIRRSF